MCDEADDGHFGVVRQVARDHRIDDAKLTDTHVLRTERGQFLREQVREVELLARAGRRCLIFLRLRIDLHVSKKAVQRRFSRRLERGLSVRDADEKQDTESKQEMIS